MAKHVIFLGAGASYTSGYPLAEGLRRILSSDATFQAYVWKKMSVGNAANSLLAWFKNLSKPIELFREGGFGTVDEFSLLAGKQFPQEVHAIKQLVGLTLALHNPEEPYELNSGPPKNGFESSDYYPFIQRLFQESAKLRDDVAILSYNYDPYLEFLLYRAYARRQLAATKKHVVPPTELTSGFTDRNAQRILEQVGFCILKLHGTCVLPPHQLGNRGNESAPLTYNEVFRQRNEWLSNDEAWRFFLNPSPAMYFPWEIINENGELVAKEEFAHLEQVASGNLLHQATNRSQYGLCAAIWRRAQIEISQAEKISFVGLSMHKFLRSGFQYLFKERIRRLESSKSHDLDWISEIVLACPGAWLPGETFLSTARPNSPVAKLTAMLADVNPKMTTPESRREGKIFTRSSGKRGVGGVVCYETFKDFIEAEM
jgi:hypothetical protein